MNPIVINSEILADLKPATTKDDCLFLTASINNHFELTKK